MQIDFDLFEEYNFSRESKIPNDSKLREYIRNLYKNNHEFLDKDFVQKFQKNNFYSALWELALVSWLRTHDDIHLLEHKSEGADFRTSYKGIEMHFEATSINFNHNKNKQTTDIKEATEPLQTQIRSAIRSKCENYRNSGTSNYHCWLRKGLIKSNNPFILAIDITQVDQLSYLSIPTTYIGTVLPVGNFSIVIDKTTGKKIGNYFCQYKDSIHKPNGAMVSTDIFLQDQFSHVSAIIISRFHNHPDYINKIMMLIHNPLATNPLPQKLFKTDYEIIVDFKDSSVMLQMESYS
jgi:type I restriction enzyme S subunit